jgi:hypothetical protein
MTEKRSRGRPKKQSPLGPRPSWTALPTAGRLSRELHDSLRAVEEELIAARIKKRPTISHSHALKLALANELSPVEEERLLSVDRALKKRDKENRRNGGKGNAADRREAVAKRKATLRKKNGDLLATAKPHGRRSTSNIAKIILENWLQRGDGDEPPARSTLIRWLAILSTSS